MNTTKQLINNVIAEVEPYANVYMIACSTKHEPSNLTQLLADAIRRLPEPLRSREDYRIMFEVWENLRVKLREIE